MAKVWGARALPAQLRNEAAIRRRVPRRYWAALRYMEVVLVVESYGAGGRGPDLIDGTDVYVREAAAGRRGKGGKGGAGKGGGADSSSSSDEEGDSEEEVEIDAGTGRVKSLRAGGRSDGAPRRLRVHHDKKLRSIVALKQLEKKQKQWKMGELWAPHWQCIFLGSADATSADLRLEAV